MEISKVQYDRNYRLKIVFSDGKEKIISFKKLIESSKNEEIKKMLDIAFFKKFHIEHGGLHWDNNSLSLSAEYLYEANYDITI